MEHFVDVHVLPKEAGLILLGILVIVLINAMWPVSLWDESHIHKQGPAEDIVPRRYNIHAMFQSMPMPIVKKFANCAAVGASLMLFNLTGNLNVGMCIRTAAIAGFKTVYVVGKKRYDARSAVGAQNYIRIERHATLGADVCEWFATRGLMPILVEQGGTSLPDVRFRSMCGNNHVVFIVGSESDGIPPDVLTALNHVPRITIPQPGLIRSLNVSTAAGIILTEYTRQMTKHTMDRLGLG